MLGVEVLIRISVRIFHVDGAITMNTSDLAGIVFGRRFSTEPRLALIALSELPAARAATAAPRARPAPGTAPAAALDLDPRGLDVALLITVVLCRIKMMMIELGDFPRRAQTKRISYVPSLCWRLTVPG